MKRFLILLAVLGLTVGSVATADAKGKKRATRVERTIEASYGSYPAPVTGCNEVLGSYACLVVESRPTERFFSAKVTDTHGQPVYVEVKIWSDSFLQRHTFCGETEQPISIVPGSSLEFDIAVGRSADLSCPTNRVKTTGTISVTLSNQP